MHGKCDIATQAQRVGDVPCLHTQLIIIDDNNYHLVVMTFFLHCIRCVCFFVCALLCLGSCHVSEVRDPNSYLFNATN
jgi:hypothetical protein